MIDSSTEATAKKKSIIAVEIKFQNLGNWIYRIFINKEEPILIVVASELKFFGL